MKKHQKIVCLATAAVMSLSGVAALAGCSGSTGDPETRPFVMAIQQPDGVFNPFFSTSQYDTNILSWTQLSMFANDKSGNLVAGDNEACVVKAWSSSYDANDAQGGYDGSGKLNGVTTYELAIKNGIKFSDGEPLTIKDVLFNLYVYLDPTYTGSSTIYSTKFVGLEAYRTGDANATEGSMDTFNERIEGNAVERIHTLEGYIQDNGSGSNLGSSNIEWTAEKIALAKSDYSMVRKFFRKTLETDWNTFTTDWESYDDWGFTAVWQPFLFYDAGQTGMLKTRKDGAYEKDENGNYIYDDNSDTAKELKADLAEYLAEHTTGSEADRTRAWAIDYAYMGYFNPEDDNKPVEQQIAATRYNDFIQLTDYKNMLWTTAEDVYNEIVALEKAQYFNKYGRDEETLTIKGITTERRNHLNGTPGGNSSTNLGEECDILVVKIRGVDPKALWNLAFNVAPLHYYSGSYEGVNYIDEFDASKGQFGFPFSNKDFMNDVINAPEKVGLPVGAGAYMASSSGMTPATSGSQFFNIDRIYYERNPYFETVGSGIENAKIKFMQYKVVQQDQIINSLDTGEIDYGDPSATQPNIQALESADITHEEYMTSGYGYIGINPRYVPNRVVRRAIIKAMDTSIIFNNYYQGGLAEPIYRSMSKVNWAYPTDAEAYVAKDSGVSYAYNPNDPNGTEIAAMLATEYQKNASGILVNKNDSSDVLDYTFTIAGSSTDHPAYNMFLEAAKLLEKVGFRIRVQQSQTALSDLTTGKLTVWAAAWTSTVDPDMYQIYHKDSTATSVRNWGYNIMAGNSKYKYEWDIVTQELSPLIEAGRKTEDQTQRKRIYAQALECVMELAVEYPTYQRKDMFAYSDVLDRDTMSSAEDCGPYYGLLSRIWELNYNQ